MADWKLTVREGSDVDRQKFDDLDSALEAVRHRVEEITDRPGLGMVKAIRDYEPSKLIKARIEVSGKGFISPPTAGVDVHGDNSLLGYAGGVSRKPLDGKTVAEVVESLRKELTR
jgi:hypothetical protein